jgi:hypothetical protein
MAKKVIWKLGLQKKNFKIILFTFYQKYSPLHP